MQTLGANYTTQGTKTIKTLGTLPDIMPLGYYGNVLQISEGKDLETKTLILKQNTT